MGERTRQTRRVLIVDDDPFMRGALSQFLKSKGYAVDAAENGKEALEKLDPGQSYAAVLLDLEMPILGGMETLANIKKATPDLPVIVLTARDRKDLIDEARALGAFDYIVKR